MGPPRRLAPRAQDHDSDTPLTKHAQNTHENSVQLIARRTDSDTRVTVAGAIGCALSSWRAN